MIRDLTIEYRGKTSKALNCQFPIDNYGFPFTLNPTIGCFFGCKYCYAPILVAKVPEQKRKQFFETVAVKLNIAQQLDNELTKLQDLPQYLKRVQINESNEYYLPQVIRSVREVHNRDVMLEILQVFEKHWNQGNRWMLHILTKSHLILNHLEQLVNMQHMVQVEISICSADENLIRKLEFYTPSIKRRLETIKTLASNGIFVRVMAMPFYGDRKDVEEIKRISLDNGAKAFKNKELNYYDWKQLSNLNYDDLINDKINRVQGRKDLMFEDLNYNSGEYVLSKGKKREITLLFPVVRHWDTMSKLNEKLEDTTLYLINCGYSEMNKINWEYIE